MDLQTPTTRSAAALTAALLLAAAAPAAADAGLGRLTCDRIDGTTRNFIITSSADVRCIFEGQGESEQWYVGETGVKLGLDLKWTSSERINFAVLSTTREFTPEGAFLTGEYSGAKVDAAVGVGGGAAVLLGGSGDTTALQPAITTGTGVGVAAGVGFLSLKPDALNVARTATLGGSPFTQALYSAYFSVALEEYRAGRFEASDQFADKAIAAASGQRTAPNRVEGAALEADDLVTLTAARERVVAAQGHEFAASAVGDAAAVQAYYDCWMRAAVAPPAPARAAECRQYFDTRIAELEKQLAAQSDAADVEAQLMKPRWWTVYFATDESDLDATGETTIAQVVDSFRSYKSARIYVWGHTDRVGSKEYNLILSKKRSDTARAALVSAGIPEDWIRSVGYGKKPPYRITTNPHDATNRRVDIVVEPLAVKLN